MQSDQNRAVSSHEERNCPVVPVILSGGSGSRLWPKSRKAYPKQLHRLYGEYTMLQHTALRVNHLAAPIVVCNEDQRFMVAEQLNAVCDVKADIILEPIARNTAPAIVAAAHYAKQKYRDPILVILSADHLIKDVSSFRAVLEHAMVVAGKNRLVTFGVVPSRAETGYGYIKGETSRIDENHGCPVMEFVEKPDEAKAQSYLESGDYFWNSGMFVSRADLIIDEIRANNTPWLEDCLNSVDTSRPDLDFVRLDQEHFAACQNISIDFALLEQTDRAWVIPFESGWSDLGSWESVWLASDKDVNGNSVLGDTWIDNCTDSLIQADKKLVVGIGLKDIAVIDTDDAILVVDLRQSQGVKSLVEWLQANKRSEANHYRQVHRPWGSYDVVAEGGRYRVNRIEVKPGACISEQMHHHRAEHWVVVRGTAKVQKGQAVFLLGENESTYIPLGEHHQISNPGRLTLHLIEVQSGSYLGDDDVVRLGTKNNKDYYD